MVSRSDVDEDVNEEEEDGTCCAVEIEVVEVVVVVGAVEMFVVSVGGSTARDVGCLRTSAAGRAANSICSCAHPKEESFKDDSVDRDGFASSGCSPGNINPLFIEVPFTETLVYVP